jgi:hypothetical protein
MPVKNVLLPIPMLRVEATGFNGTDYMAINSGGLAHPCCILRVINASSVDVTISYDGVTAHDYVLSGDTINLYAQTNAQPNTNIANFKKGTVLYALGAMGTGYVYVAGYYQPQD